jgi:hypothetical protein
MNTDVAVAVSDRSTDELGVLFGTAEGRQFLAERRGVPGGILEQLPSLGLSSIANVLAAIKTAKYYDLGPSDVVVTVATDGAAMYGTEREKVIARDFGGDFDALAAAQTFGEHLLGAGGDNLLELSARDRERIFNLGYFTWVEQQGVSIEEFVARKPQRFWREMRDVIPVWDALIEEFNAKTGALAAR